MKTENIGKEFGSVVLREVNKIYTSWAIVLMLEVEWCLWGAYKQMDTDQHRLHN